ncbi:MAG: DUF4861 family protein [Chitinispirillaceae bacterium]|nr:DUF4861 family protein [Chitinispirillaceae bacterium]
MNKYLLSTLIFMVICRVVSYAEPNGAVLYRNGKRLGYHKVPSTAEHHYFGYLEGPAWENKYSAFRIYIDKDDRNALDIIGKYKEEAILQHFSDTSVDEHGDWPWGTDILKIGSSMGLGPFRLYTNNNWLNPQIPENLDSLVVTILDSSVQTPKVQIGYHGWNIGSGSKVTVLWTITTKNNERPTHCEVAITGSYTGKVVVGLTNHRENTSNPNRSSVQLIQDEDKPLLATLGKQCGLQEGFADTCLMAVFTNKSYFDSFVKDGTVNYGMVLKPDADKKVKWSIAYSWAREANPLFRNANWKEQLTGTTDILSASKNDNVAGHNFTINTRSIVTGGALFSLSGRLIGLNTNAYSITSHGQAKGLYVLRENNATAGKFNGFNFIIRRTTE